MSEVRNFADYILTEIKQATLTDEEASLLPAVYDEKAIFASLAQVINNRGATGNGFAKLKALATLRNVDFSAKQNKRSDILIGMVLE